MELGVQLFGCSKVFREDTDKFFDEMKSMGYTQIEPCILYDKPGESKAADFFTGVLWAPEEAAGFKKELDKRGMYLRSSHAFCSDIEGNSDVMLKLAEEQGVSSFVFNIPQNSHDNLEAYAATLEALALKLAPAGAEVWIHNTQGDLRLNGGTSVFETVLKLAPHIFSQIDTGWAIYDDRDAAEVLSMPSIRLHGLHIKDLDKDFKNKDGFDIFAVLGSGLTILPPILEAAKGVKVVIDQDMSKGDFIEDLRKSAEAVRKAEEN